MRKRLTPAQEAELIRAYQEWEPRSPGSLTLAELAATFDVTKQTMMNVLERHNIPTKATEKALAGSKAIAQATADGAFDMMLERLVAAEMRCKLLELELKKNGIPLPA